MEKQFKTGDWVAIDVAPSTAGEVVNVIGNLVQFRLADSEMVLQLHKNFLIHVDPPTEFLNQ